MYVEFNFLNANRKLCSNLQISSEKMRNVNWASGQKFETIYAALACHVLVMVMNEVVFSWNVNIILVNRLLADPGGRAV